MNRKFKLVAIASLVGIAIPGALVSDLLIFDPVIVDVFECLYELRVA